METHEAIAPIMELLKKETSRVLGMKSYPNPEALVKQLASIMEAIQAVAKISEAIKQIRDFAEEPSHRSKTTRLAYGSQGLSRQGISKQTGKSWVINVSDKDVESVIPHIGNVTGQVIKAVNVLRATKLTKVKLYVILEALETIGILEHPKNGVYERTSLSLLSVWDKLRSIGG